MTHPLFEDWPESKEAGANSDSGQLASQQLAAGPTRKRRLSVVAVLIVTGSILAISAGILAIGAVGWVGYRLSLMPARLEPTKSPRDAVEQYLVRSFHPRPAHVESLKWLDDSMAEGVIRVGEDRRVYFYRVVIEQTEDGRYRGFTSITGQGMQQGTEVRP